MSWYITVLKQYAVSTSYGILDVRPVQHNHLDWFRHC